MLSVNAGTELGCPTPIILAELRLAEQRLKDLDNGKTTASKIMGEGGRESDARAYLSNAIQEYRLAAETGGFLEIVNIRNYSFHLKSLLRNNL